MCCDIHIGIRYSNKLTDCKSKCNKIINGQKITEDKNNTVANKPADKKKKIKNKKI